MATTADILSFSPSKKNSEDGALQVHVDETSRVVTGDGKVCVHEFSRVVRAVDTGSKKTLSQFEC